MPGRKRCLAVDVLGGWSWPSWSWRRRRTRTRPGIALLEQVAAHTSTVSKALVDQGFKNSVVTYGAAVGIDVEVVERNPADRGILIETEPGLFTQPHPERGPQPSSQDT